MLLEEENMKLKKLAMAGIGVALALSLAACGGPANDPPPAPPTTGDAPTAPAAGGLIGISMPTTTLERWNNDGAHLKKLLEDAGYQTDLEFADNKTDVQISQLQNMINNGAKALVIAAIDGTVLGPVLQTAADGGVVIIAYDRLIKGTPNVDYYATFDNYMVGQYQGKFLEEQMGLASGKGPFNLEPFAGSPDDSNAGYFFAGAWDVLRPYFDSGQLVAQSGKAPANNDGWQAIGIQAWNTATAQSEMENRLNSFYTGGKKVDAVLSPNDSLALGIAQALEGAGYQPGVDHPLLTGQDGDVANVKNILAGRQSMTVWKDTRNLGDQVAKMIDQIFSGATVDVNDTETYHNDVKIVPSFLLPPKVITADTVQEMIDAGFLTAAEVGL